MDQAAHDAFLAACQQMMRHRQVFAKPKIEQFILDHVDASTHNLDLMAHIVAESLIKRLDRELVESRNIYVEQFDIPQIQLFYMMARAYPQIDASHAIANHGLAWAAADCEAVTLLDIGIGKGRQASALVEQLADWPGRRTRRLHVVAVDPDPQNLEDSAVALHRVARGLPIEVTYAPVGGLVEKLPRHFYATLGAETGGALVINAAYTLHHTTHRPYAPLGRTALLRRLADTRPRLISLVEPSADHDTENLGRRFHNCWWHFGTVFDLIDEAPLSAAERFVIKEKFFGREIRDLFGVSDRHRCERHEPCATWLLRLHRAGFVPAAAPTPALTLPAYCDVTVDEGLVRLGYRGMNLISVMLQRPR
ncbi:MAG: GRAS family protein [bacterium]|nr:hypothetical protein [Myxococcales bacterium]